jgi:hypothetical protein
MTTDGLPQYANGEGYYEIWAPRGGSSPTPAGPTMLFAGIAAALGVLVGTLLAAEYGRIATSAPIPVQVASTMVINGNHPADAEASAPSIAAPADATTPAAQATTQPSPDMTLTAAAPAVHIVAAAFSTPTVHSRHLLHRAGAGKRHSGRRRTSTKNMAYATPVMLAAFQPLTVPAEAPLSALPVRTFMVEGDVTVEGYDAAAGTIETREGMNFVIDRAAGDRNAAVLEDSPGSFHYRCDQTGSCTLNHHGMSFSAARTVT